MVIVEPTVRGLETSMSSSNVGTSEAGAGAVVSGAVGVTGVVGAGKSVSGGLLSGAFTSGLQLKTRQEIIRMDIKTVNARFLILI